MTTITPQPFAGPLTSASFNDRYDQIAAAIDSVIAAGLVEAGTTIDALAVSGQPVVPVASTAGFAVGDPVWIGTVGSGLQEARVIDSIQAGVSLTLTENLSNTHAVGAPVTRSPSELVDARGGAATLGARLAELSLDFVSVRRHGATGNGVTDDSSAIQSAIDVVAALPRGGTVYFPPGTYKLGTTLTLASNVRLLGAPGVTLDASTTTKIGSARIAMRALGSLGASIALSANAVKGEYTVTVADASSLAIGDWVVLATEGVNYYPYAGGVNVDRGELKRIRSKAGNVLTFEQAVYDAYTTANSAFIKKATMVSNVSVERIRIVGADVAGDGGRGISLSFVDGFRVADVDIEGIDVYCVQVDSSLRGEIAGCRMRGVYYDGVTGSTFYGVAVLNAAQWIRVVNNHGERMRHLYVNSSDSTLNGRYGQPRHIVVDGNVAQDMEAGGNGHSWAYEHHGFGEGILISNNVADGCYGGFVARGPGVSFIGNIVRNWQQHALQIDADIVDARDILIAQNVVEDRTLVSGGSATARAIFGDFSNATALENVVIDGNVVTGGSVSASQVNLTGAVTAKNLIVQNNVIRHPGATTWTIRCFPSGTVIRDNIIEGSAFGIRISGANQIVKGNTIRCSTDPAVGEGVFCDQDGAYIIDNELVGLFQGVDLTAAADNCVVVGNVGSKSTSGSDNSFYSLSGPGVKARGNVIVNEAADLASAATLTLPTSGIEFYRVTGTTNISSITASHPGRRVTLHFTGAGLTVVDGSNLVLAGNFVAGADDTITLVCNGTNWIEVARSNN